MVFKNRAPFTKCISQINNTQLDGAQEIDLVMPMYNLIKYSDNCSKTSGSLWKYHRYEPRNNLANSESLKLDVNISEKIPVAGNTNDVEMAGPLKYLSHFSRTLEMLLFNCEINLDLTWSATGIIINSTGVGTFAITYTKLHAPVVTLSTEDNATIKLIIQQSTIAIIKIEF